MPALLFHSSGLSPKKDGWQEAAGIGNGASAAVRLLTEINTWEPRCIAAQIPIRLLYDDGDYLHCLSKVILTITNITSLYYRLYCQIVQLLQALK